MSLEKKGEDYLRLKAQIHAKTLEIKAMRKALVEVERDLRNSMNQQSISSLQLHGNRTINLETVKKTTSVKKKDYEENLKSLCSKHNVEDVFDEFIDAKKGESFKTQRIKVSAKK